MIPDIKTLDDLQKYLLTLANIPNDFKIAVGSLIFTSDDKVILIERGMNSRDGQGKLEGVGGGIEAGETDLILALKREIKEELGDVEVDVFKPYSIQVLPGESYSNWVVVNYLCRLKSGTPSIQESDKIIQIHFLHTNEINTSDLSFFQLEAMEDYWKVYGNEVFYKQFET